jgi:hypothetical protein
MTVPQSAEDAIRLEAGHQSGRSSFQAGHWDEPNVVAHMRVNDRVLPSGEKALHVEEWQSDWAQALRDTGEFSPKRNVQSHPLVENWQDLVARRTLKEAVDGSYDRITWTTGQQQADRYDLAQHVSAIRYDPHNKALEFLPPNFGGAMDREWRIFREQKIEPEEIAGIIGKEPARKLLATPRGGGFPAEHEISGLDLKVGGEWANKLYDESMVNRFNKIGKRYGVKVEDISLRRMVGKSRYKYVEGMRQPAPENYEIVHSFKIAPEMKLKIGAARFHPFADLP